MADDSPVLQTLEDMTAASIAQSSLSPRDHILVRIAALVAVGAPPATWLVNAPAVTDVGLTLADVQGVLVAVAPLVGAPRVMEAAGHIMEVLGLAVAVLEAELEAEADAQ